jgi:hypothetical protein
MFWQKKSNDTPDAKSTEAKPQPKKDPGKLADQVRMHIINEFKGDPSNVWKLHVLSQQHPENQDVFKFRVYSEARAEQKKVKVEDYTSLDGYPGLVDYQGTFNKKTWQMQFDDLSSDTDSGGGRAKIYSKQEIQQQLESLTEPRSTTFFYLGGSPATGGPLGRGAAIIELNPNYPGKKQQKFQIFVADVDGTEINGSRNLMFQSDKASDIASWVKERHYLE